MDLLDKYKETWSKQVEMPCKFSTQEIYKMAHAKSSSIVKWIFMIGILEFIFMNSLYFFMDMEEAYKQYEALGLESFVLYSQIVAYAILFYFLAQFYLNYIKITTISSTKLLMKKILQTRKTVRNYVFFNLSYLALCMIVVTIATININIDGLNNKQILLVVFLMLIATVIFLGLFWLFYQLLYGILLKKLNRNYKELAKLESEM
ncbi:hypothetical protein [Polaribacter gangjinensis]|uniref:Beta-carotene 15,15'-monooxygenase n=1 Tax=Polaribacter gangjinensis TaxID=574710 RepID=A0A2S7WAP2_9FLAO|nr:hypothetical protein [Polaribacter gangjinensis]PQJ74302.1 hypothetical protein BTO13_03005 [Polaribacter gangjinensis]